MRKFKINRASEPKLPDKAVVEKYKDFSRLSHAYDKYTKKPKVPIYKDKKMFLFILLVALLAYLIAESIKEEKEAEEKNKIELKTD